ncbi:hypothetical protein QFC24_002007 [Naganishia onofrii]|uniref:Uncharacterized protein n=1 Tax=Naganishia onofrii TaxID=1851511 RepID=A0ACC2XRK0_9TREE|nr:hypothetical protein QFC24_002007 [Naganishia onofrii]
MATPTTPQAPLGKEVSVAILGGGIAGLSTALALARQGFQDITIYEAAKGLGEVGAGINITINLARIMERMGCLDHARDRAVALDQYKVLESENDEQLTHVDLDYLQKDFGYPFLVVHRRDLQGAILKGCQSLPDQIKFQLHTALLEVDYTPTPEGKTRFKVKRNVAPPTDPESVKTSAEQKAQEEDLDREEVWLEADLVIAADGIRSVARRGMLKKLGEEDHIEDTGQAAYRILVHREQVLGDPELLELIDGKTSYRWIGEGRHIIASSYPIANNTIFNMSTAHPDTHFTSEPTSTWTSSNGSKEDLLDTFKTFCPRVQKLLKLVPAGNVLEWRLRVHLPLKTWVDGNVCLTGDAAHSTLPHLAQGAAQAAEDAAVLAVVMSKISKKEDIHKALKVYEAMRKSRAEYAVAQAQANGKGLQLSGGADREARNKKFKEADSKGGANPDKQVDKDLQKFLYGVDIAAETEQKFDEIFAGL